MDPYKKKLTNPIKFLKKVPVTAKVIAVLSGTIEKREMEVIYPETRALRYGDIFELCCTDEDISPGSKINKVSYLGFLEVTQGGILKVGDEVIILNKGEFLGTIGGFNESHAPNHINVILSSGKILITDFKGLKLKENLQFFSPITDMG